MQTPVLGSLALASVLIAAAAPVQLRRRRYRRIIETSLRRRHDRPALAGLRLSVVVPAFREEGIGDTVARLRSDLRDLDIAGDLEIIVVDDGSGDDTADRADAAGADLVLRCPVNRGKGAAVRFGMLSARGRVVAFTDADLAYAPGQLLALLRGVEDGWDLAVGSREHPSTHTVTAAPLLRRIGHHVVRRATGVVLVGRHTDSQCGIKAFRRDVAHVLFARTAIDRFAFDIEVLHLAERYGLSVVEEPVAVVNSGDSTVRVVRDMARLARDLVRIRWFGAQGRYDLHAPATAVLTEAAQASSLAAAPGEPVAPAPAEPAAAAVDAGDDVVVAVWAPAPQPEAEPEALAG